MAEHRSVEHRSVEHRSAEQRSTALRPPGLGAVTAVLGATALIGWHGSRFGNWIVDDAAITFAYARSIAEGHGPVLQPGAEPSEGFSNPSWLLLLTLGRLLGLFDHGRILGVPDYVVFPKALALVCCAGIVAACHYAAARVTSRPAVVTFVAGVLLAANPSFVIWSFSGLENALFALAVTWLAVVLFRAAVDGRLAAPGIAVIAGALAALAALTRPDGLIYALAYPLALLVLGERATLGASARSALLSSIAFAFPVGGYLGWRYLEFGHLLSLPAVAKNQELPEFADLARSGELVEYVGAPAGIAFAVLVGLVLSRPSAARTGMIPLLVTGLLAVGAYAMLKPDWMGELRFATPVWALGAPAGALAGAAALRQVGIRGRVVLSAILAVALALSGTLFASASEKFRAAPTVPMCVVAERFGRAFNGYADIAGIERGSLLLPDVGATALISRLRVVDLAGLTEPRIAEFWSNRQWTALRDHVYDELRPTFIHAHGVWGGRTGIVRDPRLDRDYALIRSTSEGSGDWVRRDAVSGPAELAELRAYARDEVARATAAAHGASLGHCGPTLRPGQLPTGG
ncbi:hypothetical protein [Qaidamihabitans albus]|uniref:hypothetical protein n=1 Tax=Qaidamihabitans albus TaxID=2795733 RepID=UPI001F2BC68A|nr:hypothetical protein [Qaidamihabitans albus]